MYISAHDYPLNIDQSDINKKTSHKEADKIFTTHGTFGLALYTTAKYNNLDICNHKEKFWLEYFYMHYFDLIDKSTEEMCFSDSLFLNEYEKGNLPYETSSTTNTNNSTQFKRTIKDEDYSFSMKIESEIKHFPKISCIKKIITKQLYNNKDCLAIKLALDLWEYYLINTNSKKHIIEEKNSLKSFYNTAILAYQSFGDNLINEINSRISKSKLYLVLKSISNKVLILNSVNEYRRYYEDKLKKLSTKSKGLLIKNFIK